MQVTEAESAGRRTTEDGVMWKNGCQCASVNLPELTQSVNNSSSETRPLRWVLLFLFPSLSHQASSEYFSLKVESPVSGLLGSSVSLPCAVTSNMDVRPMEVRWYRPNMYDTPALFYRDTEIQKSPVDVQYQGRVFLLGDLEKGDVSVKLENLMLTDRGDYVCYVKSDIWFDKATVSLRLRVVGSTPVLSICEAGEGKVNVSCQSHGWVPEPSITWTDKDGRDLKHLSNDKFTNNSVGTVDVSSWLIVSPSESEWISCSVGLSDQERKEDRIMLHVPARDTESLTGYIIIIIPILLVLCVVGIAVYCVLRKKGEKGQKVQERLNPLPPPQIPNPLPPPQIPHPLPPPQIPHPLPPPQIPHPLPPPQIPHPLPPPQIPQEDQTDASSTGTVPHTVVVGCLILSETGSVISSGVDGEQQNVNNDEATEPQKNPDVETETSQAAETEVKSPSEDKNQEEQPKTTDTTTPTETEAQISSPVDKNQQNQNESLNTHIKSTVPTDTNQTSDPEETPRLTPVCVRAEVSQQESSEHQNPETLEDKTHLPETGPADSTSDNRPTLTTSEISYNLDQVKQYKVNISIDPEETPESLIYEEKEGKITPAHVYPSGLPDNVKIFTLCKERFQAGKHYWEVKVRKSQKTVKHSWFVGVASHKAERIYNIPFTPQNGFWVLCYEGDKGVYIRDQTELISLPDVNKELTAVGVFLDCDTHTLSFYNINTHSHIYTFTNVDVRTSLRPLISPGIRDPHPVWII
ncbi:E3 ubiquitin-protein ligase TRIM17-like [Clarias gariepinus]|uniref:E3 ubiquitin-protein ligase TRIM17-like n=1 Tax=Clarias gariepinus TaxID=13013 RepID=UPI00234CFD98|nr:E3 ubiquitin-protein ligase TRIM17-like [Clarias gariepinus]